MYYYELEPVPRDANQKEPILLFVAECTASNANILRAWAQNSLDIILYSGIEPVPFEFFSNSISQIDSMEEEIWGSTIKQSSNY